MDASVLAGADGALGFWAAAEIWPETPLTGAGGATGCSMS